MVSTNGAGVVVEVVVGVAEGGGVVVVGFLRGFDGEADDDFAFALAGDACFRGFFVTGVVWSFGDCDADETTGASPGPVPPVSGGWR